MSKLSFSTHPYLLGFEALESMLERSAKTNSDGYPPYNIEQASDDVYRISLAVAGFSLTDLSVIVEGPQLEVRGDREQNAAEFLHQGIAARPFRRTFVLADCIEVTGSILQSGLLHIDLSRNASKPIVQKIEISARTRESER
ncbi:MAG: Hsp20 family protein [Paracoccaceae bacterium]|jgi:HSP20 family molecular chaperone IbpA